MTGTDALDAGLMAVADGIMDAGIGAYETPHWRDCIGDIELRDTLLAALRAERVRGEESMRERAAAVCAQRARCWSDEAGQCINDPALADVWRSRCTRWDEAKNLAAAIKALPTTDQETTHG